ncbi:MAG: DUF1707 SHOCT-like domain-containing protein [Jiangellaceae bacterium]
MTGPMTGPVAMRIGDADRDRAVAALGDHYAAGRLTAEEFDDRSSKAWQARTAEDLAPLFADLPDSGGGPEPTPRARPGFARHHPRVGAGRRPPLVFLPVVLLVLAVVVIVALPWPLIILFWWWALGSLFRFAHGRGSGRRHVRPHGWA